MTPSKTASRLVLGAAVAAAALLGTTGCSLIAPQATLIHYDPAEGVGTDLGSVAIRNAEAVANPDSGAVSVVFTAISSGTDSAVVYVSAGPSGVDDSTTVTVPAGKSVNVGAAGSTQIQIGTPTDAAIGALYPVTFQAGGASSVQLSIPVLTDQGRDFLSPYVPTVAPTTLPADATETPAP